MKGKLKALILGLLCMCLATGCVKHNVTMAVNDDKSVTLEMIYGIQIDTSMFDDEDEMEGSSENTGVDPEDYKFLEKAGYKVEPFSEKTDDGTLSGVKVTKTFANIDDITADKENKINLVSIFDEKTNNLDDLKFFYKDGNSYASNFYFDYETEESDDEMDMSSMESMFDLKYTLKLPNKASKHNATKVSDDNKEYTWKLKYSKKNDIDIKFKTESSNTMYIIIGVAAVAVVGIVVAVVLMSKKKTTTSEVETISAPNNVPEVDNTQNNQQ